jgi:hypothetical protein
MMVWFLVITMHSFNAGGVTTLHHEFKSSEECQSVAKLIYENERFLRATCIPVQKDNLK